MNTDDSNPLCLECGLCCNGVIFADVQLQPDDDRMRLAALGFSLGGPAIANRQSKIKNARFSQPCAAFDGCRCRIYADRPKYCRAFDCLLLKSVKSGRLERAAALRVIRTARRRAERVRSLLRELGDTDETLALSKRFRRLKQRFETADLKEQTADQFGQLTLAVHDLNVLLSDAFYPGDGSNPS